MRRRRNFFRQIQKKTFDEGRFRNPYFSDRPKHRWKMWVKPVCVFLLVIFCIGFFLYTPWLRVSNYSIVGIDAIPEQEVINISETILNRKKLLVIPNNHVFFLPKERVEEALLDAFRLDNVDVAINSGTLEITVSEKVSRFVWSTGGSKFVVDDTGVVLYEYVAEDTEPTIDLPEDIQEQSIVSKLIVVSDLENTPVHIGDHVLESNIVLNILSFLSDSANSPIKVAHLEIDSSEGRFLRIITEEGYAVFMDPTVSMNEQLDRLLTTIRGETVDPTLYEYIDVRFGDRVYIKDKL